MTLVIYHPELNRIELWESSGAYAKFRGWPYSIWLTLWAALGNGWIVLGEL